mgnify:CR=1 FL=1
MNNINETILGVINTGLEKAFKRRVIRIDMDRNGNEVVTLQNENGHLEHWLRKLVDKELLEDYEGKTSKK